MTLSISIFQDYQLKMFIQSKFLICFVIILNLFIVTSYQIPRNFLKHHSKMVLKLSEATSNSDTSQIFIGNLPFNIDESNLADLIKSKYSTDIASLKLIKNKDTGKSRGFGYVTYNSKAEAESAVAALADLQVDGRYVKVDLATGSTSASQEKSIRPQTRERGEFRVNRDNENKLFVGNLDFKVTQADVFGLADEILGPNVLKKVDLIVDKETRKPRGFGYLHFSSQDEVQIALEKLNGVSLYNRELRVDNVEKKDGTERKERSIETRPARPYGQKVSSEFSVYLGNLAWEVNEKIIEEMLNDVVGTGLFTNIRMATDKDTGKSRGFCHVDFKDAESMERALVELDGIQIYDRILKIDKAQAKAKAFDDKSNSNGGNQRRRSDRYAESDQSGSFNSW